MPDELDSRAANVLSVLLEANGNLAPKATLMDRVWPDVAINENILHVQVTALRRAFSERRALFRTVPGCGHHLLRPDTDGAAAAGGTAPHPRSADGKNRSHLSIVVLPFTNLSGDLSLDYLVDRITDMGPDGAPAKDVHTPCICTDDI